MIYIFIALGQKLRVSKMAECATGSKGPNLPDVKIV